MRPTTATIRHRLKILSPLLVFTLLASACGGDEADVAVSPADRSAEDSDAGVEYPLTVENCGEEVTFESAPERVMLVNSAPVTSLAAIGVLDRVVSRAGAFPDEYYDEDTRALIADIPSLGEDLDASGHLVISQEVIIAEEPDLLLGLPDGITRESLAAAGIQQLSEPAFCPEGIEDPDFDDVYAQVELYGQVFDRQEEAAAAIEELQGRVDEIQASMGDSEDRSAAVLFPTVGGGTPFAYGTSSMAHPQLEAAGFTNVFGDVDERVFEVTLEELISRNPDVLVLLHVDGEPGPIKDAIVSLPGADGLTAVQNDDILVQLFNFTEPPTPVSLDGLERIAEHFGSGQ